MKKRLVLACLTAGIVMGLATVSAAGPKHKATAKLHGPAPSKVNAAFQQQTTQSKIDRRLAVQMHQGFPLQKVPVLVNGKKVSAMTVNAFGRANLNMRSAPFVNANAKGVKKLPANFPMLKNGDVITVGKQSGVFFSKAASTGGGSYVVHGSFDVPNEMSGTVAYTETLVNGSLDRRFEVICQHVWPDIVIPVFVKGAFAGTFTTGWDGWGTFVLRKSKFIDGNDPYAQPMPDDFPTLVAGDVVIVGHGTVKLSKKNGGGGGGNGGGNGDDGSSDDGSSDDGSSDDDSSDDDSSDDGSSDNSSEDDDDSSSHDC